jgi:hypothetical protein
VTVKAESQIERTEESGPGPEPMPISMSSLRPNRTRALLLQAGLIPLPALVVAAVALTPAAAPSTANAPIPGASYTQAKAQADSREAVMFCNYLVDIAPRLCFASPNLGNHNT